MNHANLRKALFAAALVAGLGTVPFAQVQAQDSTAAASKADNPPTAAYEGWLGRAPVNRCQARPMSTDAGGHVATRRKKQ